MSTTNKLYTKDDLERPFREPESRHPWRTHFRRDYARLVHSAALRRLAEKTQLFPGNESDFFRNRLSHSMEVAQIAKSIGMKFNNTNEFFKENPIDLNLLEFSALAHDIGHPPFGHIGERALDDFMKEHGGFEGNAHTLRLLETIEKKVKGEKADDVGFIGKEDLRFGINPTYRSLASILKYNVAIPHVRKKGSSVMKGHYESQKELVQKIKDHVTGIPGYNGEFKTIECQIMDIADDIAYSTFDLEDSFKAKFISPLDFITVEDSIIKQVHGKAIKSEDLDGLTEEEVRGILSSFISSYLPAEGVKEVLTDLGLKGDKRIYGTAGLLYGASNRLNNVGYARYKFTSALIDEFIDGVDVKLNDKIPALSSIAVDTQTKRKIECLKHFVFYSITMSSRLRLPEYRGYEIVETIISTLINHKPNPGHDILPNDYIQIYNQNKENEDHCYRTICDFVAGMTDRYVIEFYGRLKSENPQTIFKPI